MLYEKIYLDQNDKEIYLEVFVAEKMGDFVRDAILVIPGGGYCSVSEREGEPIAQAFMPYGFNAFVLHYSVNKKPYPKQLIEASLAMKHIKDNAEKYNINPDRVFAVGFSAGGHLAGCLGTMWAKKEIYDEIDMPLGYNKPTGMMLIYPVTACEYHMASFRNLLRDANPSKEMLDKLNIANNIDENSSPAYIVHSSNDNVVLVQSSLIVAEKLATLGKQFELHIYPDAPHGAALANEITKMELDEWVKPDLARWIEHAVGWSKNIK